MIKKQLLALTLVTAVWFGAHSSAFAATGIFEGYAQLDINAGGNTFYDLIPSGPDTINPNFDGTTNTGSGQFLGTFNPAGNTLLLNGGQLKTFEDSGDSVTAAEFNYRVYLTSALPGSGSFTSITLSNPGGISGNDRTWDVASLQNIDLLASLLPGSYVLEVFGKATTSAGDRFKNGDGTTTPTFQNYRATFDVVPEPSTISLLVGSSIMGGLFLFRRKRA